MEYPNGTKEFYDSMKDCESGIGLTKPVIIKIIRSGKPYKIPKQLTAVLKLRLKHLDGIIVYYGENAEVTN